MPVATNQTSLCAPDEFKSCFACCPPIRPRHYEHIQFRSIIKRELAQATETYRQDDEDVRPITGYSCWALGYLDKDYSRVGCLLHPARNNGRDLRYRVYYGNKCEREACPQARTFQTLTPLCKRFLLALTADLDSFSYSSKKNPLFHLLLWGSEILEFISSVEKTRPMSLQEFEANYEPVFLSMPPKSHSYLLNRLSSSVGPRLWTDRNILESYLAFWEELTQSWTGRFAHPSNEPFVHNLKLDPLFIDFLKSALAIDRLSHTEAITLRLLIDSEIDRFSLRISSKRLALTG